MGSNQRRLISGMNRIVQEQPRRQKLPNLDYARWKARQQEMEAMYVIPSKSYTKHKTKLDGMSDAEKLPENPVAFDERNIMDSVYSRGLTEALGAGGVERDAEPISLNKGRDNTLRFFAAAFLGLGGGVFLIIS